MAHKGSIRSWDYLAVGNIVSSPGGKRIAASCALCGQDAWIDPKGALYTAPHDCSVVCDACGDREAPDAMVLVRQLRACGELTAAVAGASLEIDSWASMCPLCHREQEPDERIEDGCWRVVDALHGRAVCSDCLPRIDPALVGLIQALERLDRGNQMFGSIDSDVKH